MFMPEPSRILNTMEDVREAMQHPREDLGTNLLQYNVKSQWLIGLIDELSVSGFVYNAQVKKLAEERLGLPARDDTYYSQEGDVLSLLIYNAQKYRNSDRLKAQGFVPFTTDVMQDAFQSKKKIQLGSKLLTVKKFGDKLYAMEPRRRKYGILPQGQPVALVGAEVKVARRLNQ